MVSANPTLNMIALCFPAVYLESVVTIILILRLLGCVYFGHFVIGMFWLNFWAKWVMFFLNQHIILHSVDAFSCIGIVWYCNTVSFGSFLHFEGSCLIVKIKAQHYVPAYCNLDQCCCENLISCHSVLCMTLHCMCFSTLTWYVL
jgi:hypothetical protein